MNNEAVDVHVLLHQFTTDRRLMPYEWGKNDCIVFSADWVLAKTGVDPIAEFRESIWTSEADAMEVLAAQGGLIAALDAKFPRRDSPQFAQRGDLLLVRDGDGNPSLAVCTGRDAVAPGTDRMLVLERVLSKARIAWEV